MANTVINTAPEMVLLQIRCPSTGQITEKRFDNSISVGELKGKLELITGMLGSTMDLGLYSKTNAYVCGLIDNMKPLSAYNVAEDMVVEVTSSDPKSKVIDFSDPNFQRYELNEDDYDKRPGTVRAFLKQNQLGTFSGKAAPKANEDDGKEEAEKLSLKSRCLVTMPNQSGKKGVIIYIGKTDFKEGYWVGVRYDEPVGKNDGSVNGKRYFECQAKHGGFVKPKYVTMGDYPEDTYSDDDEM
ncbi:Tubulin folding cofactor B S homeolog [Oopsacas minuta]|uniref:Tubulin folding cofactor B S homeolog n=1 Tax=Oopsacas minuta TaxID=111878 RepID=A0AAV7JD81_9METZ|nr:Tubulin folding cofactor B S homeolog [Oopsacas minuta]